MPKALVIEDQNLMLSILIEVVQEHYPSYLVLGASTFEMAQRLLSSGEFDLVLIDPGLPGIDPSDINSRRELIRTAIQASPNAVHVVLTGNDSAEEEQDLRALGANAYLGKTGLTRASLHEVLNRTAAEDYSVKFSESVDHKPHVSVSQLSLRERQILELMLRRRPGQTRQFVYHQMGSIYEIDAGSAERYFKSAIKKLRLGGVNVRDV